MRIAVCLSGQSRTIKYAAPSILNFFSEHYSYDYFCHAWDYNNYKRKESTIQWTPNEILDRDQLASDISIFNPKALVIQGQNDLPNTHNYWSSLFYSAMYANHLKKKYEIENNFRYDLVIKFRYDLIFNPSYKFILNHKIESDLEIYCLHHARMPTEYMRPNFSDVMYYGSSRAMDCLADIYKYINTNTVRMDNHEGLGPGTWLTKYANNFNLRSNLTNNIEETIYRDTAIPCHYAEDYAKIREIHFSFYR